MRNIDEEEWFCMVLGAISARKGSRVGYMENHQSDHRPMSCQTWCPFKSRLLTQLVRSHLILDLGSRTPTESPSPNAQTIRNISHPSQVIQILTSETYS
jgi:hypothetical protein